jgi:hypothetical protein
MVDFDAHPPKKNFEQFSHRAGSSKIFEQDPRPCPNQNNAPVGQLNRDVATASRINFFSREEHISALCDTWSLCGGRK